MAIRQDAWHEQHDALLLDVTLRHIRDGSTQMLAFEEVGLKLGRTAAACAFRWNASVRKQYAQEIHTAKTARLQRASIRSSSMDECSIEAVMTALRAWKKNGDETRKSYTMLSKETQKLHVQLQRMHFECEELRRTLAHVHTKLRDTEQSCAEWKQCAQQLRQHAGCAEDVEQITFRMEANGNLERIVQREHSIVSFP